MTEMNHKMMEVFEDCPVIAAVKDEEGLKKCLESEIPVVFVLYGDICNIGDIVGRLKKAGKMAIIHLDLITGLSSKEIAVEFLKSVTHADGIISTKPAIIRKAKEEGMFAIMRFFVIDSIAFESIEKQTENVRPDMIEVLPGVMPKIIKKICRQSRVPVIAGGLITDKEILWALWEPGRSRFQRPTRRYGLCKTNILRRRMETVRIQVKNSPVFVLSFL